MQRDALFLAKLLKHHILLDISSPYLLECFYVHVPPAPELASELAPVHAPEPQFVYCAAYLVVMSMPRASPKIFK